MAVIPQVNERNAEFPCDAGKQEALLGKEKGERGRIILSESAARELEVRQIHKPHNQRRSGRRENGNTGPSPAAFPVPRDSR